MKTIREVEDKYDVDPNFVLPSLVGVGDVASASGPRVDDLTAVYFDTADFRLARNKIVLRRREGGPDAGWHLKLPGESARTEIHRPLGKAERPPAVLRDLVFARTRGQALAPAARLVTNRATYELRDASEVVLAELADDRVNAQVFAAEGRAVEVSAWREVEVELASGTSKTLKQLGRRLVEAGAVPSTRPSKYGGLLGDRVEGGPDIAPPSGRVGKKSDAREVIQSYLLTQTARLLDADLHVRLDEPESIHDMRVASRRIRSSLKTFRRLLDAERAVDLEGRLRDLGIRLGAARDSEVLLERLLGALDGLPETFVLGPVRLRLEERLRGDYLRGRSDALRFMTSAAYGRLLDDLIALVHNGFAAEASGPASRKTLARLVRRSGRKVVRRVHAVQEASDTSGREQALHQARKAAKQARYAAELAEPAFGGAAGRIAKPAKEIQEILGEHQDTVVASSLLRELGLAAHGHPDESAFTFGLLAGLERERAGQIRREFDAMWDTGLAKSLTVQLR